MTKKSNSDTFDGIVLASVKGGVAQIPFVGSFLAEYLELAHKRVEEKRLKEWMSLIELALSRLEDRIETLSEDEGFYSCVQAATAGALQANEEEKRKLFANALCSAAVTGTITADKKLAFFSILQKYTLSHILLLGYFSHNNYSSTTDIQSNGLSRSYTVGGTESPMIGIQEGCPQLAKDPSFIKFLVEQLVTDGLIGVIDLNSPVNRETARMKRTTPFGDEFLCFIKSDSMREV